MRQVKIILTLLILSALTVPIQAQQQTTTQPGELRLLTMDQWLSNNIDPDVLHALQRMDAERTQRVLTQLQDAMRGTNIYQLADLRQAASELAPLLLKYRETYVYGQWLQSELDYMEAAQEMEQAAKAAATASKSLTLTQPTQRLEREVWIRRFSNRSLPVLAKDYVPRLKQVFISEGLPPELVWIAEVESSFNPNARSPAGAAGMFQLMPETARDEALSLWPWDERLHPEKSAHAAAKYLRSLHEHYGNWELVLAAYNAGEGRVDKLLKQNNARSFDAIARRLPAETQMYVPKVEATIWKREGRELADLKMPKN